MAGRGGRFPAGYPVARVISVENDPGAAFLYIDGVPTAQIDRASQVLLVWRGTQLSRLSREQLEKIETLQALRAEGDGATGLQ